MATTARKEKRACYLINFSTVIQTLDLTEDFSMAGLMNFLRMPFHGGTDAAPALLHAFDMMKGDSFAKADILVMSNFLMDCVLDRITEQRARGPAITTLRVSTGHL